MLHNGISGVWFHLSNRLPPIITDVVAFPIILIAHRSGSICFLPYHEYHEREPTYKLCEDTKAVIDFL